MELPHELLHIIMWTRARKMLDDINRKLATTKIDKMLKFEKILIKQHPAYGGYAFHNVIGKVDRFWKHGDMQWQRFPCDEYYRRWYDRVAIHEKEVYYEE
jgi:hypothetical protein